MNVVTHIQIYKHGSDMCLLVAVQTHASHYGTVSSQYHAIDHLASFTVTLY